MRRENDLPTLRVHLRPAGGITSGGLVAEFEVVRGTGVGHMVIAVPTMELGLADWIKSAKDVKEGEFAIDEKVARRIGGALSNLAEEDDPAFWLELPPPRGYLHFVPWERLLSPVLDRPLLRLPNYVLRPSAPGRSLHVVLVVGQGPAKPSFPVAGVVERLTQAWLTSVGRAVQVEVLVDAANVSAVRDRLGHQAHVVVHDPDREFESVTPPGHNEWCGWVERALGDQATDVVHLVGHGTLAGERGELVLPRITNRGPDAAASSTLGVVDLCGTLNRIGAWSLMISAPPHNHCPPGLRDLAHATAQARPGVVELHELGGADEAEQMKAALRMIYDSVPPHGPLPRITCWSHLSSVGFPESDVPLCTSYGTSALVDDAGRQVLARTDTPAWVAAGVRTLESLQAQVIQASGNEVNQDAITALEVVSRLFEEHVRTYVLDVPEDGR